MTQRVRTIQVPVCKVNAKLGLVLGYAIVCKVRNQDTGELEDYYDSGTKDDNDGEVYSDHIPEQVMLEASTEFMKSARVATEMHERVLDDQGNEVLDDQGNAIPLKKGTVLHSLPLTTDVAEMLGIKDTIPMTGWIVGMFPEASVMKKFESGELRQFSIAGGGIRKKVET